MPIDKQVLLRYRTLNNCFRNIHKEYDIDDLVAACNESLRKMFDYSYKVSKRTIQNDIMNLQLPPYNVEFDERIRSGHKRIYRYKDSNFSLPLLGLSEKDKDKIKEVIEMLSKYEGIPQYDWIRTYLSIIENDQNNVDSINSVVFQNNPDLIGLEFFSKLQSAILNHHPLSLKYKPYLSELKEYKIHPYLLKQYNDRWFLLSKVNDYNNLSVFALDRIVSIKQLSVPFQNSPIDLETYFDDIIGVSKPNEDIVTVIIKVSNQRYPYIETKPIHYSQTEIKSKRSENYHFIKLRLIINKEFKSLLLSFGDDVEVIEPQYLRDDIKMIAKSMNKKYSNSAENLHS